MSRAPIPGRGRRDLAAPAVALAALVAVVGVAAAARVGGDGEDGGSRVALPQGFFAWFYAGVVVAGALAFPFFLYISTRTTPYERRGRLRAWLAPLWVAGIAVALLVFRWLFGDQFETALDRLGIGPRVPSVPGAGRAATPPRPETTPVAALLVLGFASVGAFLGWRAWRRRGSLPSRVTEELAAFVEATIDEIRAEADVRRAIVRAYAGMERTLERSGCARAESEAPLEYVAHLLLELDVRPAPVQALTDLFERAKFSAHPLGEDAKRAAIAALEDVRAELTPKPAAAA